MQGFRQAGLIAFLIVPSVCVAAPLIPCDIVRHSQLLKDPMVLIDVRSPGDFAKAHIQGAKSVPAVGISTVDLPKDSRIVVYCAEAPCPLSMGAADRLIGLGYSKVSVLEGGLGAWISTLGIPLIMAAACTSM